MTWPASVAELESVRPHSFHCTSQALMSRPTTFQARLFTPCPPSPFVLLFWSGVVCLLLGQYITFSGGGAVYFVIVALLLSAGLRASRGVYRGAAVCLLILCALCVVGGLRHDAQQARWRREHPESFFAKSPAEQQQWLREHDPSQAKPHSHPWGLTTRSSEQPPAFPSFLLFHPLPRRWLSLSLEALGDFAVP